MDRKIFWVWLRFHKNSNEESDKGYFLEVDVWYTEKLHALHNDLPFLPERMNIEIHMRN